MTLAGGCGGREPSGPPPPPPPPAPTQLAFTIQPSQALRDSTIAPPVTVEVRGASGARIAGATNTVMLALGANPSGAALGGTTTVAAVDGLATFANLRLTERARGYALVAASGTLTPAPSSAFNIVVPLVPAVVEPGTDHTCAVVGYGVYCWGRNANGELGDSTLTPSALPVRVPFDPPHASFVHLALGDGHTCATTSVGELYCWGSDSSGQLGIASQQDRRIFPTLVSGGISFAGVAAGRAHTCAVAVPIPDSTYVHCWGANDQGQLGDSTNAQRTAPVAVAGRISFSAVTAGTDHTCAVATATGTAYCWGDNTSGQLGDGSTTARNSPVPVAGGHRFIEISAGGNHTCGVTGALEVYCWGENADGQLGDGTTTPRTVPVLVAGGVSFVRIEVGGQFSCAEANDQALYCWGRNLEGELGIGTLTSHLTPQPVAGNVNPTGIAGGGRHACTTTFNGVAYCWGSNTFGKLGDGTTTTRPRPVLIVY
ncbi:MAG TPA: hypothetical protein VGQ17_11365 [Gemmatimonadales bacterium]|jgi:alpha-tubulin suppressor-like RCC1 family protein|nr:hypothetical protein [Gemmatimonadales bacterium]